MKRRLEKRLATLGLALTTATATATAATFFIAAAAAAAAALAGAAAAAADAGLRELLGRNRLQRLPAQRLPPARPDHHSLLGVRQRQRGRCLPRGAHRVRVPRPPRVVLKLQRSSKGR